uniref:Uncharacterized protein n=1 Tax=Tetranychus urticae TaxID=32264 RepID=T1JVH6_TETUR
MIYNSNCLATFNAKTYKSGLIRSLSFNSVFIASSIDRVCINSNLTS